MTKAEQIVALLEKDPRMNLGVIAERVGCHPSYVRTAMHRSGIFRGKHDPNVVYEANMAVEHRKREREELAKAAESRAQEYEREAASCGLRQASVVPEPQLSKLKAAHWRIIAKWIRETYAAQPLLSITTGKGRE